MGSNFEDLPHESIVTNTARQTLQNCRLMRTRPVFTSCWCKMRGERGYFIPADFLPTRVHKDDYIVNKQVYARDETETEIDNTVPFQKSFVVGYDQTFANVPQRCTPALERTPSSHCVRRISRFRRSVHATTEEKFCSFPLPD